MAKPRHYERVVCACCFLFIFVNIGLASTSFSVYQPYVVAIVGDTAGSMVLVARTFTSLVCMFLVAKWYRLANCRVGVFVPCMLTVLAFVIFGLADNLPAFLVAAVVAGAAYGLGGMVGATLLVGRWFKSNVGTAVGIASAGSGAASVLMPIVATQLIHTFSLAVSFWFEAGLACACGLAVLLLLRNDPSELGLEPYMSHKAEGGSKPAGTVGAQSALEPFAKIVMMVAAFLIGAIAIAGYSYLGVLMTSSGFEPFYVATMLSVSGLTLMLGKLATGVVFDAVGTHRGSAIFFGIMIVGLVLCCLSGLHSELVTAVGMALFGCGTALGSVGISVWSLDLSTPLERVKLVRDLQVGYATGGFVFNFLPGPLMDLLGNYVVSYALLTAFAVACFAIIMLVYARKERMEKRV